MAAPRVWTPRSEAETRRVGARLAAELAPDGLLLLSGDLGAGKTVLARGVAEGLGVDPSEVQSPTFVLVREHESPDGVRLVHADLYRLAPEETAGIGVEEILFGPGVKVVEWAERLPEELARALCTGGAGPVIALRLEREGTGEASGRRIVELPLEADSPPRHGS